MMGVKLYPLHFTRAVDTSDKVRARLAASKSGIFPSWNGLQTVAGAEFVDDPADAEAVLLFQSLPFEFIWDNGTYAEPLPVRPRSLVREVEAHRTLQDVDLPVLYLYTDLHMVLHDTFVRRPKRASVYDRWGVRPLDPRKFTVLHGCRREDELHAKWNRNSGLKIAREGFIRIDHDALYWTGECAEPSMHPLRELVYVGNSQHGKKTAYLSRFDGLHVYGGWTQTRKNKLPNAIFHAGVKYSDSFALMNRYWGHVVTTSVEQMAHESPYTKLVLAVAAGTLPIVDPRLEYYLGEFTDKPIPTVVEGLSHDTLLRSEAIKRLQALFAARFEKIDMKRQLRRAVDAAKDLYMKG